MIRSHHSRALLIHMSTRLQVPNLNNETVQIRSDSNNHHNSSNNNYIACILYFMLYNMYGQNIPLARDVCDRPRPDLQKRGRRGSF